MFVLSRPYSTIVLSLVLTSILVMSGCIFADYDVTVDIYGADQIAPNVTKPNGLRVRINNEVDTSFDDMEVRITVPERIVFRGSVGGKPLEVEKGLEWTYSFTTDLAVGDVAEYSFTYEPQIYEEELDDEGEFAYSIRVRVFDNEGRSIGNATTTWRVVGT